MTQSQTTAAATSVSDALSDAGVHELTRRVAALEDEVRTLLQLAEYRSVVISRVAHELRTPLTSILGFTEIMLNQEQLNEPQRNFCERIQNSALQLQGSLTQLSDLSRLDPGKSALRIEEFSLEDLIREILRTMTAETKKSGIHLEWRVDADLPPIISDRVKLRQTLRILLEYVIAQTKSGARINLTAQKDERSWILKIEGQAGMANVQSAKSDLGLAIARYNLELIGAVLTATDRRSEGLELVVQLPVQVSETNSH